jgi:para-aminobenzoate synthetase component 1
MTCYFIEKLPYHRDAAALFGPFANSTGAIWLDSSQHARGRFDVFATNPLLTLTAHDNTFSLTGPAATNELTQHLHQLSSAPPAARLFKLIESIRVSLFASSKQNNEQTRNLTPAQQQWLPGVMGLLSYSAGSVDLTLVPQKDGVSWPQAYLGYYAWLVVVDHQEQCAWLIAHTQLTKEFDCRIEAITARLRTTHNDDNAASTGITSAIPPAPHEGDSASIQNPTALSALFQPQPDQNYSKQFERVKAYLTAGDCYQINLARRFQCQVTKPGFELYKTVRQYTRAPYSGFFKTDHGHCLCFSPEQFLTLTPQRELSTSPIKGTRPRAENPKEDRAIAEDLAASAKDRAENLMIVDLLRNDFGRICQAHSIHVPQLMAVHSFSTVHHLISEVKGRLRDGVSPEEALSACFPGGSITGAPKKRAMQIIDELELYSRHAFCGSLCHLGANGTLNANICIRTGILQENTFTLWAGGGIVIDSELETEWVETLWKVQKILEACQETAPPSNPKQLN